MATSETTPESIRPGMLFCERYRIERRLDDGGMATIYLATDESDDRPVAIKVLFDRYSDNEVVRARFLDEGRIQAMLDHPNIVHVHRIITDPLLCFVMEYVDGDTLDDYLQKNAPLDEGEIVDLIMPVMSAIGFAHNKGIVHRDLKPSNVLLDNSGAYLEPKVMDFGVAKISRGKDLTVDGTTVGTLHYMSPEQIVGASDIDGRADIYSLGCSLYKLCTGEVPFNASSEFALMMAHVEAEPTPPGELRSDLSSGMEDIILQALHKKPEQRFQTIKEMTAELMEFAQSEDDRITITRPIPGHLLQFAMDADEVANDKTQEIRLEHLIGADEKDETVDTDTDVLSQTHELSAEALRKLERDRLQAKQRHTKDTRSMSKIETIERDRPSDGVDEEAETTEQKRRDSSEIDTTEKRLDQLTTRPTTTAGDADLATTAKQKSVIIDEDNASSSEIQKTVPMPRVQVPEDEEDGDVTDKISVDKGPKVDRRHVFERHDVDDVDSQEVTEVLRRDELEASRGGSDSAPAMASEGSGEQRTVEQPLPEVLQGGGGGPKTLDETSISTKKTQPIDDDRFESQSTAVERPKGRTTTGPGRGNEVDTLEERPAPRRNGAEDESVETAEQRPSAKISAGDEDSDPTLNERPSARASSHGQLVGQDVEERSAVEIVTPRRADPEGGVRKPSTGQSSDRDRDVVGRARADRRPTSNPSPSKPSPPDPESNESGGGDAIEPYKDEHRQSTQSTELDGDPSSNLTWAIAGVAALLIASAILAVVLVFL